MPLKTSANTITIIQDLGISKEQHCAEKQIQSASKHAICVPYKEAQCWMFVRWGLSARTLVSNILHSFTRPRTKDICMGLWLHNPFEGCSSH